MLNFEILCVTMHQKDFSKINDMNIHSNVVFANQADTTSYNETKINGKYAKMVTTDTRGVGINRNLTLMYASADICMFADDDVIYNDDMEQKVLNEFESHPDADIIIFHFDTDSERKQKKYSKTKKCGYFSKMPWGGFRIAFRLNSVKKANVWFTTLFGGGCIFPSGEDSMWLADAKKHGLTFYVSKETIGTVSFDTSTWFTGYNEKFFWGKGAFYQAVYKATKYIRMVYFTLRTAKMSDMSAVNKIKWMIAGAKCYKSTISYELYCDSIKKKNKLSRS